MILDVLTVWILLNYLDLIIYWFDRMKIFVSIGCTVLMFDFKVNSLAIALYVIQMHRHSYYIGIIMDKY